MRSACTHTRLQTVALTPSFRSTSGSGHLYSATPSPIRTRPGEDRKKELNTITDIGITEVPKEATPQHKSAMENCPLSHSPACVTPASVPTHPAHTAVVLSRVGGAGYVSDSTKLMTRPADGQVTWQPLPGTRRSLGLPKVEESSQPYPKPWTEEDGLR